MSDTYDKYITGCLKLLGMLSFLAVNEKNELIILINVWAYILKECINTQKNKQKHINLSESVVGPLPTTFLGKDFFVFFLVLAFCSTPANAQRHKNVHVTSRIQPGNFLTPSF